jgi:hypothetical protein
MSESQIAKNLKIAYEESLNPENIEKAKKKEAKVKNEITYLIETLINTGETVVETNETEEDKKGKK